MVLPLSLYYRTLRTALTNRREFPWGTWGRVYYTFHARLNIVRIRQLARVSA
jgi:hypothetical protein